MNIVIYSLIYVMLCIITAVIFSHMLGSIGLEDSIFIGFVGVLSPIILPFMLIGILGNCIYKEIEKRQ